MAKYNEVSSSGAIRTINSFEDDLLEGRVFGVFNSSLDYESNQTFGLFLETLDNDILLTVRGDFNCGTDSLLIVYEGVTVNPGAIPSDERIVLNINRSYPNLLANVKSIANTPTVGSVSITDTADTSPVAAFDNIIIVVPFGGDRSRFTSNGLTNVVLASNTIYGIEFTPGGAGGTAELAAMQLIWSERTLETIDQLEDSNFFEDVRRRILKVNEIVE